MANSPFVFSTRGIAPKPMAFTYAPHSKDRFGLAIRPDHAVPRSRGQTLIIEKSKAEERQIAGKFPCRMITLNIHSSLEAVGFLAVITTRLATLNMDVNPVSAFYHDHLFVPAHRADDALEALVDLTKTHGL